MSIERLSEILDAYGADPLRWPPAERLGLQGLAARDPRAAGLVAEAERLDGLLDLAPSLAPSALLSNRILANRPRPALTSRFGGLWSRLFPDMPAWRPALGIVTALVLGVGVQVAAADRLGLGDGDEVATTDAPQTLAPLSGGDAISEEDVL